MSQQKSLRVAVVGGGIAGTLCSLVLQNHRGITPILIDQGRGGLGGRLRNMGAQFLRASDPRLVSVMGMLQNAKVVQEWKGRFGLLGSQNGGFLPAANIVMGGIQAATGGSSSSGLTSTTTATTTITDTGDFCQFVQNSNSPTFVGVPTNQDLCSQIATLANITLMQGTTVRGASMGSEGNNGGGGGGDGWILDLHETNQGTSSQQHFDALILATHDPSFASTIVQSIVNAELEAVGGYTSLEDAIEKTDTTTSSSATSTTLPLALLQRLSNLSRHLQQVRDQGRVPLYTLQATYPAGFSESIPFDAVSVPGSPIVQFLAREASKPGRVTTTSDDIWTAISTSQLASQVLDSEDTSTEEKEEHIQRVLTSEMAQLFSIYFGDDGNRVPTTNAVQVKRWGAALCEKGLELQEDSIILAGWRLGICGDFIRQSSAYPTPWEAAAVSGLDVGQRMASVLTATTTTTQ